MKHELWHRWATGSLRVDYGGIERGMHQQSGRQKEALLIRQANRAAMVGRLLLGEVRDWSEFLEPEVDDLANLPRRQLKSGKADVRGRLSHELMRFCDKNFVGMNVARLFAARATVIACFNLMEAYLNGLAWDYLRTTSPATLSTRSRKLLDDSASASIRDKLRKYPEIISGATLWTEPDSDVTGFLDIVKPFRDSLVHPSPFSAPQKLGGHDKLRLLYRIDNDTAQLSASLTARLIARTHRHLRGDAASLPGWFEDLYRKFAAQ